MGDLRILDPRFGPSDIKPRGWPSSMYRNHHSASRTPSYCYRPVPLDTVTQWISPIGPPIHDYNYLPPPRGPGSSKGTDYYYLTPLYRNPLPQPQPAFQPIAVSPRMMMMEQQQQQHQQSRSRLRSSKSSNSAIPNIRQQQHHHCTCQVGRTRSLDDVRSEVSEWDDYNSNNNLSDVNGNRIIKNKNKYHKGRRSMDNLLEVDVIENEDKLIQSRKTSPNHVNNNNNNNSNNVDKISNHSNCSNDGASPKKKTSPTVLKFF